MIILLLILQNLMVSPIDKGTIYLSHQTGTYQDDTELETHPSWLTFIVLAGTTEGEKE